MDTKKILIICFCITFIIMSVESSIIAMDYDHLDHCDIPDCPLCNLITIAIDFMRDFHIVEIIIFSFGFIISLIKNNNNIKEFWQKTSLVEMKVILNN